jgi:hypothetical protein
VISRAAHFGCIAHAGMIDQAKALFFVVHVFSHVLMFGLLLANGFASGRGAIAQFGCLPYGSLLTNQPRQSAIRHCLVNSRVRQLMT